MPDWRVNFDIPSGGSLPVTLIILGFIAIFLIGVPLYFIDSFLCGWVMVVGLIIMFLGIALGISERR